MSLSHVVAVAKILTQQTRNKALSLPLYRAIKMSVISLSCSLLTFGTLTFYLQVFFPLAPGIESIWEPFQEEVEARVQDVQQQFDDVMDGMLLPVFENVETATEVIFHQMLPKGAVKVIFDDIICLGFFNKSIKDNSYTFYVS